MRFDLISIFPEYFTPLELSLLGKARKKGEIQINIHDLRNWSEGKHRSVDDSPVGGGAGMVMRPDVWGHAIDASIDDFNANKLDLGTDSIKTKIVLAVPTPSGIPLTQRIVEDLTQADQIIVACGRYEGIDARVSEYYKNLSDQKNVLLADSVPNHEDFTVLEFSLGDYVLNGGEAAALILVEAVGRLLEGVIGNPDSLIEESHAESGLLEYPVYSLPRQWRKLDVPTVLTSGDHAKINRWRRDESIKRTAQIRPDIVSSLTSKQLNDADRAILAREGWTIDPVRKIHFRKATQRDIDSIVKLAARTVPDACPEGTTEEQISQFIEEHLSKIHFEKYLSDDEYMLLVTEAEEASKNELVAYSLCRERASEKFGKAPEDSAYLSKFYVDNSYRGTGLAQAFMEYTVEKITESWSCRTLVLGTNRNNKRASKFYRKSGFKKAGRREFLVGGVINIDDVFVRKVTS